MLEDALHLLIKRNPLKQIKIKNKHFYPQCKYIKKLKNFK